MHVFLSSKWVVAADEPRLCKVASRGETRTPNPHDVLTFAASFVFGR